MMPRSFPLHGLGRRVLPRHPAEQRALDPGRVLRDAGERDRVLEHLLVRLDRALGLHQPEELLLHRDGLLDRLADHEVGEHGRGRLADRAAGAVVRDVLDHPVGHLDPQRDLVPAGRVHVVDLGVVRLPQAAPVRVLVVVQDDLLVQRVEFHPKTFRTSSRPRTRASTSSRVVYR
jgi:hypothetical protein